MFAYFPTLVVAYLAGMTLLWFEVGRRGLSQRAVLSMSVWAFFAALVGSKVFHVLFDGFLDFYLREPQEALLLWRGGQVFYGGLLFGVGTALAVAWRKHVPWKPFLDALAPAIMLGLGIGRLGCYMAGCCYGAPTDLPWGIQYGVGYPATLAQIRDGLIAPDAHYGLPIHPTQLYESAFAFALCAVTLVLARKVTWRSGRLFGFVLAVYAAGRFTIEFWRADPRGTVLVPWLSTSQVISIVMLLSLASVAVYDARKAKRRHRD